MSLINQMLRDLEARRAAEANQSRGIFGGLTTSAARPRLPLLLIVSALGLTAVAAAGATWFWLSHKGPAATTAAAAAPTARPAPTVLSAPPQPAGGNSTQPVVAASPASPRPQVDTPLQPVAPAAARTPAPVKAVPAAKTVTTAASDRDETAQQLEFVPRAPSAQQRASALYQEAIALLRQQRGNAAEAKLREALRAEPGFVPASETLGVLLINAGRMVEARDVIEAGRKGNSSRPTLELLAARIRVADGDIAGAIGILENGLPFSGGRPDYVALLAALYQKQGRHRESAAAYERVVALAPADATAWVGLAISDEALGKTDAARQAYTRALGGALPGSVRAYAEQRLRALKPH